MRPQEDYLRTFAILLTERGVVAVSDPQQIAVYDYLCGGKKRPIDIAESLGYPSSSLHFVLDKMVDSGIIVRSKPDPAKKEVYYSILALRIAGSTKPTPEMIAASEETFKNPDQYFTGLSSVANMLESYTSEIGLDHGQLRARYAKDLADSTKDYVGQGPLDGVMQSIRDRFCSITGYRMSVFSLNPPTIIFEGNRSMWSKIDMLSLFVKFMMENATGRNLAVKSVEDFSNDDTARFKVTYDRCEPDPEPYINTSLPQMGEPDRFMVVEIDGGVALLMNDIQTKLIEAVYERPLCVTDIVNAVSMPRSTVTTNLLRMVEEGVLSVFYSESGALYYGLSCSILMKRVRRVNRDPAMIRNVIRTATKDGGFVEGYLLYLFASLQELGFDTDYMMVVLGAKYMRTVGQDGPKNFDAYFGKMSEIAKVVGLSLSVVSVYPLTIGISRGDGDPGLAPAMTFVKGMAHQGLEMASSGIFVRVSEESEKDMKVSFKEIYPSLSMTPAAGSEIEEAAAEATTTKRKRTSSVRDALRNRSAKSDGKPMRTTRYITGVAMVVFASLIVILAMGGEGNDNTAVAETYVLDVDVDGVTLLDADDAVIDLPCIVRADSTITVSVDLGDAEAIGLVKDGIAYTLSSLYGEGDTYTIGLTSDLTLIELKQIDVPEGVSAQVYDCGRSIEASAAYGSEGCPVEEYSELAGGLWVSENAWLLITAPEGSYLSFKDTDTFYLETVAVNAWDDLDMTVEKLPADYATVTLDGEFEAGGHYVTGSLKVQKSEPVVLTFVSTDGPVSLTISQGSNSNTIQMTGALDRTVQFVVFQDASIIYTPIGIQ